MFADNSPKTDPVSAQQADMITTKPFFVAVALRPNAGHGLLILEVF
jgi:hypothetical protein